jgi:hypothetical protein
MPDSTPRVWSDTIDSVEWMELAALYRAAPLGNKNPAGLKTAFTNSLFRCFVREDGKLVPTPASRASPSASSLSH